MRDLESELILIYCVCDDCLKMLNHKDDPQCKMSTAEVMTMAIASAYFFYGNFRMTPCTLLAAGFMKKVLSESQLNRRWHAIDPEIWLAVFRILAEINKRHGVSSRYYAVDSFPMPACQKARSSRCKLYHGKEYLGVCQSKSLQYYGLKIHIIVTESGTLYGFYFTPASRADVKALEQHELHLPKGSILLGDKAYTSYELEDLLQEQDGVTLLPLRKKNLTRQYEPIVKQVIQSTRKIVETTISCIQRLLPKAIVARSARGFELKILMCILAKSCSDYWKLSAA